MIDPATPDDIPDLAAMLRLLNGCHAAHLPDRFHQSGSQTDLCAFFEARMDAGGQVLLYKTEGVARGYAFWEPLVLEDTALTHARRCALLDHVFVMPGWRRRGIARRLLRRFEADIKEDGFSEWTVRVDSFNAASLALMKGAGAAPAVIALTKALS